MKKANNFAFCWDSKVGVMSLATDETGSIKFLKEIISDRIQYIKNNPVPKRGVLKRVGCRSLLCQAAVVSATAKLHEPEKTQPDHKGNDSWGKDCPDHDSACSDCVSDHGNG